MNAENVKNLRQRLGWCRCELARHLSCDSDFLMKAEAGEVLVPIQWQSILVVLEHQAQSYADEVQLSAMIDQNLETRALEQITFTDMNDFVEKTNKA